MDDWLIFSISADIFCLLLCVIAVLIVLFWRETLEQNGRYLFATFSSHGLCVLCNLLGLAFKGWPGGLVHGVLLCTNFGEFGLQYITGFFLTMYFTLRLVPEAGQKNWKWAAAALCAVELLVLVISQPTGFYYFIDADNFYHRSAGFPISLLFGILTPALDLVMVLRYRRNLRGAEKFAVWTYLALEKMRYEDMLHVDDAGIEVTGFLLPFMSMQPLVENAVKHGLADKPEGGTIWLSSREVPSGYEVVIRDDGVGFDPAAPVPEDGRSHIGIESVRSRLKAQSSGTLTLESAPGLGTTATITIPKE